MKRITQLDGLRAVAILAVFVHHAVGTMLLWSGVDLFFILSGFLITNILLEAKQHSIRGYFAHFYERRARRILAPYLLTLAGVSLLLGVAWTQYWYFYIFLANFLMPLNLPMPYALQPLWSLAVEEQFYIFWPFAVYFLSERRLRGLSILLMVMALLLRVGIHFDTFWPTYMLTPFRMDLLAAGALLCLIWRQKPELVKKHGLWFGVTCMSIGVIGLPLERYFGLARTVNTRLANGLLYETALLLWLGFMVYALAGRWVGWLRFPGLRFIGRISYTMYLVHLPIIVFLQSWIPHTGVRLALAAFPIALAYASLSWYVMESKLLRSNGARSAAVTLRVQEQETSGD
jgi:peptidoglycan/LPS O-acetylase OafA/YrhL